MRYFYLLLLLVCTSSYGQGRVKLPKSINVVQKTNMPNSYVISINFEYDTLKRLTTWTDSIYNKRLGGITVTRNTILYTENGRIEAITSYENDEILARHTLTYEDNQIKIKPDSRFESAEKYKKTSMVILDNQDRASTFVKNVYDISTATSFEYCNKGNVKRAYTRPATTYKSNKSHISSTAFSDQKLEYGNKKGIFHDVNMPAWFWALLHETLPYIQHYNNNLKSARTMELTMYPTQKTSKQKRQISAEFDSEEYPTLIKGVLPNDLSITVSYY